MSLLLRLVKIHGQFSLISNDVSQGDTRDPRSVASKVAYFVPSYLYRPSLSRPFPLHSSLPVECESSFYPMRVYCIRTKVYTFVYSGGRGTFEHSFSISRFFRFLSLSHTLFISLSLFLSIKRRDAHVFRE